MKLYNFWRSGTSHRTRIALELKGLTTEYVAVHLVKEEHLQDTFKAVNPQQLVPALDTGSEVLIQSPAIIEWLEEKYPNPPLLPRDQPLHLALQRGAAGINPPRVRPAARRRCASRWAQAQQRKRRMNAHCMSAPPPGAGILVPRRFLGSPPTAIPWAPTSLPASPPPRCSKSPGACTRTPAPPPQACGTTLGI